MIVGLPWSIAALAISGAMQFIPGLARLMATKAGNFLLFVVLCGGMNAVWIAGFSNVRRWFRRQSAALGLRGRYRSGPRHRRPSRDARRRPRCPQSQPAAKRPSRRSTRRRRNRLVATLYVRFPAPCRQLSPGHRNPRSIIPLFPYPRRARFQSPAPVPFKVAAGSAKPVETRLPARSANCPLRQPSAWGGRAPWRGGPC